MPDETFQGGTMPQPSTRAPQKRLSDKDRAVLLELLKRPDVRVDGKIHVATVCRLTGISPGTIYSFLRSDRYLQAQLKDVTPDKLVPDEADQIDRSPEPTMPLAVVNFTAGDVAEHNAIRQQNLKVARRDWEALGMNPEDGEAWEKHCRLGSASMYATLTGVGGQLIGNLTILDQILKNDGKMILDGKLPPELNARGLPRDREEVERDWRYSYYAGLNLQLQIFSHLHKNQAILARVAADMKRLGAGKKPEEQGEFTSRGEAKHAESPQ